MKSHFESNLRLLERIDLILADRIRRMPWPIDGVEVLPSKSGAPTLRCEGPDGAWFAVHSEYDPVREAQQYFNAHPPEGHDVYVVYGLGLGYPVLEAASRLDSRCWLGCIETDERTLRAAMECVDLGPFLSRSRVFLFAGRDWVELRARLAYLLSASEPISLGQAAHLGSTRLSGSSYVLAQEEVSRAFAERRINVNTLFRFAEEAERNAIRNLPAFLRSHGVADFGETLAGIPAVVVGAGPSLNEALPHLKRIRDKAVIVAVGRTLRRLVQEGIAPHFVATLDPQPFMAKCFEGFEIPEGVIHFFDCDADSGAVQAFPGDSVSYDSESPFSRWLQATQGTRGRLIRGGSVIHSCYSFARYVKCDPVLLVGVDMSFPTEKTHADGVVHLTDAPVKRESDEWVTIPGASGKPVRSIRSYASFVTMFELLLVEFGGTLVQTSEIGAAVQGAEHLSLSDAIERYLRGEHPIGKKIQDTIHRPVQFDPQVFGKECLLLIDDLRRVVGDAAEGLEQVRKLARLDPGNKLDLERFGKEFGKGNEIRNRILENLRAKRILSRLCARTHYAVRGMTRDVAGTSTNDPGRLKAAAEQLEVFFKGYRESAEFFAGELEPVAKRIMDAGR